MGRSLVYPKLPYSTANRYKDRATYDLHEVHKIINTTKVLHISFNSDDPATGPYPTTLPMIGQMGSFAHPSADLDEPQECYLHGYVSMRMANLARSDDGLAMTISATKVDGLVLSLTPYSHSYTYRSAVLFGRARVVTDAEEKLFAMRLITESVMAGRWEGTRTPPDGGELGATAILRVTITGGSGKINDKGPNDKKEDLEKEDVTSRVWTGVAPVWEVIGQPIPTKTNSVKVLPDYMDNFVRDENEANEQYAKAVAKPN
ncbi:hypothetical protein BDR22DRAFT_859432 [Usnea florida]